MPETCADHPFLQGLSEPQRLRLAAGGRPFTAAAGDRLVREGEPAAAFYLLAAGHVAVSAHLGKRGQAPIQTLGPGEVVGWSWLLPPFRWQFDARASDAVQGWVLDAAWLREQCEQDHDLGYHVLKQLVAVLSGRLAATRLQQLDVYE